MVVRSFNQNDQGLVFEQGKVSSKGGRSSHGQPAAIFFRRFALLRETITITDILREPRKMKIAIGSDHAGFQEKERLKATLAKDGVEFLDVGTHSADSVDYPDFAAAVGRIVANGQADRGILVCGSGIGVAIAANKISGVRAAQAWNEETARLSRRHNNANVLTIGARVLPEAEIPKIVKAWLETEFAGGRHADRVNKIHELE
jgi:ribose 5-phosphate isomerase B